MGVRTPQEVFQHHAEALIRVQTVRYTLQTK
jgi:hypothetical protein